MQCRLYPWVCGHVPCLLRDFPDPFHPHTKPSAASVLKPHPTWTFLHTGSTWTTCPVRTCTCGCRRAPPLTTSPRTPSPTARSWSSRTPSRVGARAGLPLGQHPCNALRMMDTWVPPGPAGMCAAQGCLDPIVAHSLLVRHLVAHRLQAEQRGHRVHHVVQPEEDSQHGGEGCQG